MIYALRNPRIASELARISAGPFTTEQLTRCLERTREFRALDTDDAKQASLDMLDLCKICVRSGRDRWVAIQRELLSDGNAALEVQKAANLEWKRVAAESDGAETDRMVNHSFALYGDQGDLLGDSDYREVLAYVARGLWDAVPRRLFGDDEGGERVGGASESRFHDRIGYEATPWFWRDGFTVTWARPAGERRSPTDRLVLKVEWAPSIEPESGRPAYEGRLLVELLSRDENTYASRLRAVLLDSGPLALFKDKIVISDTRPQGLSADQMPLPRGDGQPDWSHRPARRGAKPRHDVAISYRGSDEKVAQRVRKALTLAGIDVYSYSEDQRDRDRAEEKLDSITDVYDHLKYARSLVVVASPAYFETPVFDRNSGTVTNLYCPVELAEAVYAAAGYSPEERAGWGIEESRRSPERFVWVCAGTTPEQASASVGEMLQAYFDGIAKPRLQPSMPAIERRENESILAGLTIGPTGFLDEVGRNQMCFETYDPAGEEWIEKLVKRIRDALRH